jgi:hypothetical protein
MELPRIFVLEARIHRVVDCLPLLAHWRLSWSRAETSEEGWRPSDDTQKTPSCISFVIQHLEFKFHLAINKLLDGYDDHLSENDVH